MKTVTGSELQAKRLAKVIPGGSSTASKRATLMPEEPGVILKGNGCRVWDADGKEYIDFRNALGPITLGYRFPIVDEAVREQLNNGIIFGYPHPLEGDVGELLCELIPCAERVRFLKTGGEAVAACIRLARHYTGRKHIIQIGYNGWLNSLCDNSLSLPGGQSAGRKPGVPEELSALHHAAVWNDPENMERLFRKLDGQVAAIIVAAEYSDMEGGKEFYPYLRKLTERTGSLLVFDEIVTGFRLATGGVQEYFNVVPDLAVFAKGMANGMPLSAYLGKAKIMDCLDTVIISSTYGGETLSLAAAKATMQFYKNNDVIGHLWKMGELFFDGFARLLRRYRIPAEIKGMPPFSFLYFDRGAEAGFTNEFYRVIFAAGVCLYRGGYVNYSHQAADIEEALERIETGLEKL
ncbi:MAG: aminotransferase class III-fold pyridoxal phosphate-dependent enzyme [Victivallaceae bacterium]|nr:aminotransferase class III-fold pyridoxal phosphate-dependent enzyme [Victivallaceae bacterium]